MSSSIQEKYLKRAILTGSIFYIIMFFSAGISQTVSENTLPALTSKDQGAIIDSISKAMDEIYVFPDVAREMEKLIRKKHKDGEYKALATLPEFAQQLTEDLRSISRDKHLAVRPLPPRPEGQTSLSPEEEKRHYIARAKKRNFNFKKIEILSGNVGYLKLDSFVDAGISGKTAVAAMNFLANSQALIFDLRENGGGSPSLIQLISSYLFDEPVHLNSFYIRKTGETKQFWTQANVEGSKLTDIPVYVLTSKFTFSGAEEFTYNLKNMKRGTIVGETTGGGAHPVEFHAFESYNVGLSVPFGRAVNPITKTNWEGTGVEPDISVPSQDAFLVAHMEILKKLKDACEDEQEKVELQWHLDGLAAKKEPFELKKEELSAYTGSYGPRRILLKDAGLFYQRENRPEFYMIPMKKDWFMFEELEYFRIEFRRDDAGRVMEIVGHYDNGDSDAHKRTE